MAGKNPAQETGTYSIHNGKRDKEIIQLLGWEGWGIGDVYSTALRKSEKLQDIKKQYERFLSGKVTLGELMRELNTIRD